jgi:probable phosphoglycerate mutase
VTRFCIIQTGPTAWEAEDRFEPLSGSPLTPAGMQIAGVTACELVTEEISVIYACQAEAETETARLLAAELGVKVHRNEDLHDLDYGLWQGLTADEIKRRQPRLYKQWRESPASVCPPGGEPLEDAQRRLARALKAIAKKRKGSESALVLRPLPAALIRCLATRTEMDRLWEMVDPAFTWCAVDIDVEAIP